MNNKKIVSTFRIYSYIDKYIYIIFNDCYVNGDPLGSILTFAFVEILRRIECKHLYNDVVPLKYGTWHLSRQSQKCLKY